MEQAQAERTRDRRDEGARAHRAAPEATQGQLAEVEGQLEHAVLASDVTELTAQRAELTQQVAALDEEIKRKGPLADSAVALSARVAGLEDQVVDLTRDRDQAASKLHQTQSDLDMAAADRNLATTEYAKLAEKVSDLRGQKGDLEARLTELGAEVRNQDFGVRDPRGAQEGAGLPARAARHMLDEGKEARQQIDDLRAESAALVAQRLEIQKDLASKQAQVEILDKAIMAKDQEVDGGHGCGTRARSEIGGGPGSGRAATGPVGGWRPVATPGRSEGHRQGLGRPDCACRIRTAVATFRLSGEIAAPGRSAITTVIEPGTKRRPGGPFGAAGA